MKTGDGGLEQGKGTAQGWRGNGAGFERERRRVQNLGGKTAERQLKGANGKRANGRGRAGEGERERANRRGRTGESEQERANRRGGHEEGQAAQEATLHIRFVDSKN